MAKAAKAAAGKTPAAPVKDGKAAAPSRAERPAKDSPAAANGTTAAVISLKQMAAALAESQNMPKVQVEAMLGGFVQSLAGHLQQGSKIRIPGLGIFQVSARAARMGRNPATGEPMQIKASKKLAFRPAKELKEAI